MIVESQVESRVSPVENSQNCNLNVMLIDQAGATID